MRNQQQSGLVSVLNAVVHVCICPMHDVEGPVRKCWRVGGHASCYEAHARTAHILSTSKTSSVTCGYEGTASTINVRQGYNDVWSILSKPSSGHSVPTAVQQVTGSWYIWATYEGTCNERAWHMEKSNDSPRNAGMAAGNKCYCNATRCLHTCRFRCSSE